MGFTASTVNLGSRIEKNIVRLGAYTLLADRSTRLGHPVPDLNFVSLSNNGKAHTTHRYSPDLLLFQ